jgi:hypothetical protein
MICTSMIDEFVLQHMVEGHRGHGHMVVGFTATYAMLMTKYGF